MSRNLLLQVLRGTFASMPVLGEGELYLCLDTMELYAGSGGNKRVGISATLASGLSGNANVQAPNSSAIGPSNPRKIIGYARTNIAGTVYWVPLLQ